MLVHRLAQTGASYVAATLILVTSFVGTSNLTARDALSNASERITAHLACGEFSKALEIAETLSADQADKQFVRIAVAQVRGGAAKSAMSSLDRISNDKIRFRALFQQGLGTHGFGPVNPGGADIVSGDGSNNGGAAGGVTEADFQPLINLIKTTVDPDGWDDTNGDGIVQAYPAGVYVDSSGTLHRLKIDPRRNLTRLGVNSSRDTGNRSVDRPAKLRKISLNRLEKQAQLLAAQGLPPTEQMQHLAGIYEIEFLMFLPESNDVVIAGPAGPWQMDVDGHAINTETGKPVLQLDDLIVCLRNAQRAPFGNNGKFGCSITPRKKNLSETREFLSTSKLKGQAWRESLRETLGLQDIEVFGVDPATHAGRVLVEADYRMKLVAMGLEESIPEIPSYLSRLNVGTDGQVDSMDVVRWWFTMNYDEIIADENHEVFTFVGTGVKVLSENEFINEQGDRIHTGQSDAPTAGFARDFTRHFEKIADEYPVYRRLKNLFDLAIVSALIRGNALASKADWHLTYFGNDPEYADYVYQPVTAAVPSQVDSVLNHRVITRREKSVTTRYTLVGVSGGITFDSIEVLRSRGRVEAEPARFNEIVADSHVSDESKVWWWD